MIKTPNSLNKERLLKAIREKGQVTYKGRPIKITPDFSAETMKARRSWTDVIDTKGAQMLTQATIPSTSLNYHRWINKVIP